MKYFKTFGPSHAYVHARGGEQGVRGGGGGGKSP